MHPWLLTSLPIPSVHSISPFHLSAHCFPKTEIELITKSHGGHQEKGRPRRLSRKSRNQMTITHANSEKVRKGCLEYVVRDQSESMTQRREVLDRRGGAE